MSRMRVFEIAARPTGRSLNPNYSSCKCYFQTISRRSYEYPKVTDAIWRATRLKITAWIIARWAEWDNNKLSANESLAKLSRKVDFKTTKMKLNSTQMHQKFMPRLPKLPPTAEMWLFYMKLVTKFFFVKICGTLKLKSLASTHFWKILWNCWKELDTDG